MDWNVLTIELPPCFYSSYRDDRIKPRTLGPGDKIFFASSSYSLLPQNGMAGFKLRRNTPECPYQLQEPVQCSPR